MSGDLLSLSGQRTSGDSIRTQNGKNVFPNEMFSKQIGEIKFGYFHPLL